MRISVVVPVYNEEETVAQVLESLSKVPLDLEVVVVDDASTDRTWEILQELRTREAFATYRFVRHDSNQGKGAGLRTGFGLVSGDMVTVQDADMEYDPHDLPALVQKWLDAGDAKVAIYGRRDLSPQKLTTRWGNKFLTTITNLLYGCHIHDMETCYKMMPGALARALTLEYMEVGLGARLLMAMPPKLPKRWSEVEIDLDVQEAYENLLVALRDLQMDKGRDGDREPFPVRMTPEAKAAWVRFYGEWAQAQANVEGELAAAYSKLEGYAARLALLHHVVSHVGRGDDHRFQAVDDRPLAIEDHAR